MGTRGPKHGCLIGRALQKHIFSAQNPINIPLFSFQEADGTALAVFSSGTSNVPGYSLDNSEALSIRWNDSATPDPIGTTVFMPKDLDDSQDVVIHIMASKHGATLADATTFTCQAFFQTVGALHDADADAGGDTTAMTGDAAAKTVQEVTLTIAAADVPAAPAVMTLTIQPTDDLLDTDDVSIHAVWLEYTPQILAA
jgi:hypothetical protein